MVHSARSHERVTNTLASCTDGARSKQRKIGERYETAREEGEGEAKEVAPPPHFKLILEV